MDVNASVVFFGACLPDVCVPFGNDSVGVLALSCCFGGYDCFALLDTRFDSLVRKLSVVRVHNMAHVAALYIYYSCTQSLIHLRGLLALTNLINIRVGNAFQNLGDI